MFFVLSNKSFLQTEGHRAYGTYYDFSFLIFIFVLLTHEKASQML